MSGIMDWLKDNWKLVVGLGILIAAVIMIPDAFVAIFQSILGALKGCQSDVKNIDFQGLP